MKLSTGFFLVVYAAPAMAHHGNAEFDLSQMVRYEGTIVELLWRNPHTVTRIETRTATGEPITLEIEGSSPAILRTGGFTAESLVKGDRVTAVVSPSRRFPTESAYGWEVVKADGTVVPLVSSRMKRSQTTTVAKNIFGAWVPTAESFTRLTRSLATLELTEKGRAFRSQFTPLANGQARCVPVSAPMVMMYPVVMVLERSTDRVLVKTDWLGAERIVYTDGRAHPPQQERFPQGHSVGRWDGDELVVDTTNFSDQETGGVPSGAGKHLIERFALGEDGKSMSYTFEWQDPEFLVGAFSGTGELSHRPDLQPAGIACDREIAERFFREFQ
jgi:hypothetical protein